ncbi:MSMEG_0569 family flavin-dependent oxidoreductase [Chamaesiphon sp. GL140_3_metabinner_50]|uniref:MSMEG_0569 family flavin-dependent oxidoreductase n=1 Tax=Chamaesiphon sp. GL140_3_metabinner_50 TaxID=2970812 RepID=UPI0025D821A2|nr:MSMEG_0569 family flavin-dependent oxidoreductase [Chamaesiphon sp. GL140_3_metabinner_50]
MSDRYPVIIIGGGQAGLSMSYCLKQRGIDHIIFEKHTIGHEWRSRRWDSFCLVTPNWQCQLPGYPYPGNDPDGFMLKDEIVKYLQDYATSFDAPIKAGVTVTKVQQTETGLYAVSTSIGEYTADRVIIAVSGYHTPKIPRLAERLPASIHQLHSSAYKNPESLPAGSVLVVGTGQSGCQIAEDLHLAGRQVHLCVGGAPRSPRLYRGKDAVEWLDRMGYYDISIDEHPKKETARSNTNHYLTGRDGGREIDLRKFALQGMKLHGRLKSIEDGKLKFQDDLSQNLDRADAVAENIKKNIDRYIETAGIEAPIESPYQPVWQPESPELNLDLAAANIRAVIWSTGFQTDFSWIDLPVFNGSGYPHYDRGITNLAGCYFIGLPWLYTWGSARFSGVARDANYIAEHIAIKEKVVTAGNWSIVNEFLLGS